MEVWRPQWEVNSLKIVHSPCLLNITLYKVLVSIRWVIWDLIFTDRRNYLNLNNAINTEWWIDIASNLLKMVSLIYLYYTHVYLNSWYLKNSIWSNPNWIFMWAYFHITKEHHFLSNLKLMQIFNIWNLVF